MKNKIIQNAINNIQTELNDYPNNSIALQALDLLEKLCEKADEDTNFNPKGKVVVRDKNGKVTGLQG